MTVYHEVHTIAGATLCWSSVDAQDTPNATMVHHILLELSHQKGNPRSTMGHLSVVTNHVQAWGELHNLFGSSKVISTMVTSLMQSPQQLEAPK
jgi:hypothetical protein